MDQSIDQRSPDIPQLISDWWSVSQTLKHQNPAPPSQSNKCTKTKSCKNFLPAIWPNDILKIFSKSGHGWCMNVKKKNVQHIFFPLFSLSSYNTSESGNLEISTSKVQVWLTHLYLNTWPPSEFKNISCCFDVVIV